MTARSNLSVLKPLAIIGLIAWGTWAIGNDMLYLYFVSEDEKMRDLATHLNNELGVYLLDYLEIDQVAAEIKRRDVRFRGRPLYYQSANDAATKKTRVLWDSRTKRFFVAHGGRRGFSLESK